MIEFPNAKINLGLNILRKRTDGYHDIESCFYPVGWKDALEIVPSANFTFASSGIEIPESSSGNLCTQAFELIQRDHQIDEVSIHLHKNIPIGAGLGGGSADCAFTFQILNRLFQLQLTNQQLEEYASSLGSDCPFFVKNTPVIASGTGTTLTPISLDLSDYYMVLVYPGIHISTAEAYSGIKPDSNQTSIKQIVSEKPVKEWKNYLKNDFETSLFPKYPILKDIKNQFYESGAVYASMTGSGSAIYGLYKEAAENPFKEYKSFCGFL
ncbi:MAG: 4-(cytidine 5'-diphospho)-2-C-methyl-D-erythritol kinase [Bacteroidota bacterium]